MCMKLDWMEIPKQTGLSLQDKVAVLAGRLLGPLDDVALFELLQQRMFPQDQIPVASDWMEDKSLLEELDTDQQKDIEVPAIVCRCVYLF